MMTRLRIKNMREYCKKTSPRLTNKQRRMKKSGNIRFMSLIEFYYSIDSDQGTIEKSKLRDKSSGDFGLSSFL